MVMVMVSGQSCDNGHDYFTILLIIAMWCFDRTACSLTQILNNHGTQRLNGTIFCVPAYWIQTRAAMHEHHILSQFLIKQITNSIVQLQFI